ncbi:MAG TPA: CapA family protein [Steroidobacteraceae bacterium]|nr:CapA family protein [Steroidobacteraceae bacterium]
MRVLIVAAAAFVSLGGTAAVAQQPLTVVLTGQSMIRSDLRATVPAAVPRIRALLQGDVVFTHLEAAIAENGQSVQQGRGFLTPPESLDALQALGFNLLSLSGNHAFDLGAPGIRNTLQELNRRGIAHAGTGANLADAVAPAYLHVANMTVALIGSASGLITPGGNATAERPGVNELRVNAAGRPNEATADLPGAAANAPDPEDAARILSSIRTARQHADLVIVYQHNHVFGDKAFATLFNEGMPERLAPDPWLVKWTHAEVAAGADIVVLHGAPLLHGVEIFQGRPIFYDLGNFIYNLPATLTYIDEPIAWESVVARVEFRGRTLQGITLLPIALNSIGEGQPDAHDPYANNQFLQTRGLPSAATGAKAGYIIGRLARMSEPFGTRIELHADVGRILLRPH